MSIAILDDQETGRRKGRPVGEQSAYEEERKGALAALFSHTRPLGLEKQDLSKILKVERFSLLPPEALWICLLQIYEWEEELMFHCEWGLIHYLCDILGGCKDLRMIWSFMGRYQAYRLRLNPLGQAVVGRVRRRREAVLMREEGGQ